MLYLLAFVDSEIEVDKVAKLSIGNRDARLLQLRVLLFGNRLQNVAQCPKCTETLEWEMEVSDIQLNSLPLTTPSDAFHLEVEDFKVQFRLLNSEDMIKASSWPAYQEDPKKILTDCILNIQKAGKDFQADPIPERILEAINNQMPKLDPQANINIGLNCPACEHHWENPFDIVTYLWTEIDNKVKHILEEIFVLARAFGWSEKDILSMSPKRRQIYLAMLRS